MWRSSTTFWVVGFLGLVPATLSAQEGLITGVVVAVEDENGNPQEGVTGTLVTGGTSTQLGTTGGDGSVEFPYGIEIPTGTEMRFSWRPRGDVGGFIVYSEGEEPQECRDAEDTETEDDDCDLLGAFYWGVTDRIDIRTGTGTPSFHATGRPPGPDLGRLSISGFGVGTYYYDFTNVLGDQANIGSATGDDFTLGIGGSLEYSLNDRWVVGAGVRYNQHQLTQSYNSSDPLMPVRTSGTVDSWFWDAYVGPRFGIKQTIITLGLGASFAIDQLDLDLEYSSLNSRETRDLKGWKGLFRSTLDIPISGRVAARGSAGVTNSFEGGDADANAWFALGLAYIFGG